MAAHKKVLLKASMYCSEHALWLVWKHCGDMKAVAEADVYSVDAEKLYEATKRSYDVHVEARQIALRYYEDIRTIQKQTGYKATDLPFEEELSDDTNCPQMHAELSGITAH